ncbi:hypothetical protein GCK72_022663 [Caenorhabditis remanei]|uniref:Uncharacterized protein n=1 Tax=Caenorhabditis remanei TaxID=31234 RepID=A0A6A5FUA7_CAERE|nr:hypothetical protein GCK72_022663 [Caenorhabditis remanei]KAF1746210.1 hypothetical protein GCK72_022663 [Caenorhabditis remanei]
MGSESNLSKSRNRSCEEHKQRSLYPKPFGDPLGLEEILSEGITKEGSTMETPLGNPKGFAGKGMEEGQSFPNSPEEIHQYELDVKLQEYLDSRIKLNSDQVTEVGYCNEVDIYSSEYMFIGMSNGFSKKYEGTGLESTNTSLCPRKKNYGNNCSRLAQIHWTGKGVEGKLDDRQENKVS